MEDGGVIKFRKGKKKRALGEDYDQSNTTTSKLNSEYAIKSRKHEEKKSSKDLLNFLEETAEDNEPTFKRALEADDIINASLDVLRKKRNTENEIRNYAKESNALDEEESILMKSIEQSRKRAEKQQKFNLLDAIKEED